MRKINAFILGISSLLSLASCGEVYRLDNKPGIVWKSDAFNIVVTYNELQQTLFEEEITDYSTLEIDGTIYSCYVCFDWHSCGFFVRLFDDNTKEEVSYFGDKIDGVYRTFIDGYYDEVVKEENKDYIYSCKVTIYQSENQYYDYCVANNLECPKIINFYGYEE